jgi:hypothetical protein
MNRADAARDAQDVKISFGTVPALVMIGGRTPNLDHQGPEFAIAFADPACSAAAA